MSKVGNRVKSYLAGNEDTEDNINQTVTINLRGRAQLEALAQIAKRSKTRTASQILVAALEDAIDALPDEKIVYGNFFGNPEPYPVPMTPKVFVESFLQDVQYHAELESKGFANERLYTAAEVEKLTGRKVSAE